MIISFSHLQSEKRIPLLDSEGREVTLSVEASDRTSAINSQQVKEFIEKLTDKQNVRVRRAL